MDKKSPLLPKFIKHPPDPTIRQSTVRKLRTVYQWKRHKCLGRKYAFKRMSLFCYVWLSFVAMVLCFLVATWAQIMAVTGISPGSILATTAFPLDFWCYSSDCSVNGLQMPSFLLIHVMYSCTQCPDEVNYYLTGNS
jgi:hypothetical protein